MANNRELENMQPTMLCKNPPPPANLTAGGPLAAVSPMVREHKADAATGALLASSPKR